MKMRIFLVILALFLLVPAVSFTMNVSMNADEPWSGLVPPPKLLYPNSDRIDISGQFEVIFRWSPMPRASGFREYFDLRIYEGYDMLESTLIFQKNVDPEIYSYSLPAANFEDGKVYTFSLRQIYRPSRKSKKSFQSFKVRKDASNAVPVPLAK